MKLLDMWVQDDGDVFVEVEYKATEEPVKMIRYALRLGFLAWGLDNKATSVSDYEVNDLGNKASFVHRVDRNIAVDYIEEAVIVARRIIEVLGQVQ